MLLKKMPVAHWIGSAVVCATLATSSVALAKSANGESSEEDPHAAFMSMVSKLEKQVGATKKQVFASEGEVKKLTKRAETAGYRVAAARERFDEYQAKLSSEKEGDKVADLKNKLTAERKLLKADAEKLAQMVSRSKEMRAKSDGLAEELRSLKDDVAIEADRFDSSERGHKKAMQLIADADWALERLTELNASFESELEAKATETLTKTEVSEP
jgi:predicted  nucleic acid-binding Zn-ribbon protein